MLDENLKEARNETPEEDIITLDEVNISSNPDVSSSVKRAGAPEDEVAPGVVELEGAAPEEDEDDPSKRDWDRGIKSLTWKERLLGISQSRFALVLIAVTVSAILMGADYGSRSFGYMLGHALMVLTLGRCLFLLYKDATGHSFVDDIRQRLTGGRERSW
jgi:hypothetical protein